MSWRSFLRHSITTQVKKRYFSSKTFDKINPFGTLIIKSPRAVAHVGVIDPHEIPDGNKAIFTVSDSRNGWDGFKVFYCKDLAHLTLEDQSQSENQVTFDIKVPHNYNIDIEAFSVNLNGCEGEKLDLLSHSTCTLGKVKSSSSHIISHGSLSCKLLKSNATIKCEGVIDIGLVQAQKLTVSGNSGDVNFENIYCPFTTINTWSGSIYIKNFNGMSELLTHSGSVSVDSSQGNMVVNTTSGDIAMTVDKCDKITVSSEDGNVDLGISDSVSAFLNAEASNIDIPEDLLFDGIKRYNSDNRQFFEGKMGEGKSEITVFSHNGDVTFSRKSWFDNLKLD